MPTYSNCCWTATEPSAFYKLTGTSAATNADVYTYTATIEDTKPYTWEDGTKGSKTFTWYIKQLNVDVPTVVRTFTYDGDEKNAVPSADGFGRCLVYSSIHYCNVYDYKATHAGSYTVTAKLVADTDSYPNVTNFVWNGPPRTMTDQMVDWKIEQAENAITSLTLDDWQEGTTAKVPLSTWRFQDAKYGGVDSVVYSWRLDGTEEWSEAKATFDPPTDAGVYNLKAYICKDSQHDPGDWGAAEKTIDFCVWRHPAKTLTDYVDFIITGSSTADRKVTLYFSEPKGDSPLYGFTYARAGKTGEELRFIGLSGGSTLPDSASARDFTTDELLPFELNTWDVNNVSKSQVTVKMPKGYGNHIRMYWHRDTSKTLLKDKPVPTEWPSTTGVESTRDLVNRPVKDGEDARTWINYWRTEPTLKRYWTAGELTQEKINLGAGALAKNSVNDSVKRMPSGEAVSPPLSEKGNYVVNYTQATTIDSYGIYYTLYDGDRDIEVEVIEHSPQPVDPAGGTASGRILLGNDDTNKSERVVGQSYWRDATAAESDNGAYWAHSGSDVPTAAAGLNVHFGSEHTLYSGEADHHELWNLKNVYFGNLMTNDNEVADSLALTNVFNTLPWDKNNSLNTNPKDNYTTNLLHSGVSHFLMMNTIDGDESGLGAAYIESQFYTNGIGTVYFDVVNANALSNVDASHFELAVEYRLEGKDWQRVSVVPAYYNGSSINTNLSQRTVIDCLNIKNGGNISSFKFYRIIAQINVQAKAQFRIVRLTRYETSEGVQADDLAGFIIVDNIIASFPPPTPTMEGAGKRDTALEGKTTLGWEGAFSQPLPAAGDTNLHVLATLSSGEITNVTSARVHYRWRYANQKFIPERLGGRDRWLTGYFNLTNRTGFATYEPIKNTELYGDVEYYFDMTAFAPYYDYVDHSGCSIGVGGYCEEPEKFAEVRNTSGVTLPSAGTDWFVRLREFKNANRRFAIYYKSALDGDAERLELELTGASTWRGQLRTKSAIDKLYYRLESETMNDAGEYEPNYWRVSENITELPKLKLAYDRVYNDEDYATMCVDAATGYVIFQLDEAAKTVSIVRGECQNFNLWSSAYNEDGLFSGSTVDTNSTSYFTTETAIKWDDWEASVATNSHWKEDFGVSSGMVAPIVYPRDQPFSSARSQNGWTAENAMWTYGQWSINTNQGYGVDSAVQLEGRGKGSLSFIDVTDVPDGLDTVAYTARLAQYNEFNDFNYYNGWEFVKDDAGAITDVKQAIEFQNTTVIALAALTEGGASSYDGDGSISLVNYYHPQYGCYELRVSRDYDVNGYLMKLYRWSSSGSTMTCAELCTWTNSTVTTDAKSGKIPIINALIKESTTPLGQIFLSVEEYSGATLINCGVYETTAGVSIMTANDIQMSDVTHSQPYTLMSYLDTSDSRLTKGSFGVLTRNCPGVFANLVYDTKGLGNINGVSTTTPFTGKVAANNVVRLGTLKTNVKDYSKWIVKPGRMEQLTGHYKTAWGFQAKSFEQKIAVQMAKHGTTDWNGVATNTVSGFSNISFKNVIHDAMNCDVRLQVLGGVNDARFDVVINQIELTQWNGQWTPRYDTANNNWGLTNKFVYTTSWVLPEGDTGHKTVLLQPTRAESSSKPVSIRGPLTYGFGLFHFAWANADSRAKLLLQIDKTATRNNFTAHTEAECSNSVWTTVKEFDFSAMNAEQRLSGAKTIYFNQRYPAYGAVRLVVDGGVQEKALVPATKKTDAYYGAVEITDAYVWDLPAYDEFSWSGWNFRSAGWSDATADEFANLTDGLKGLSGLLNNTLDEDTLADHNTEYYRDRVPSVQSPTFGTNSISQVEFRARLYDEDDMAFSKTCAVVTVYGSNVIDPTTGEPTHDSWEVANQVLVSNTYYQVFSCKLKASKKYRAVRLGVKGVPGVTGEGTSGSPLRVAIDDICLSEGSSVSIAFKKLHVRPFRNETYIKGTSAVLDIATVNEQPMLGESFGFQAELDVLDKDEILVDDPQHPISVELLYYPYAEPWGYENWYTNSSAVRVTLDAATGTNLIYRSNAANSASLVPPQFLEDDDTHRIVQYHLIAHYYDRSFDESTYELNAEDWTMPSWYEGYTDPNLTKSFSAFTLLETIAPHRAWFNEINYCEDSSAASKASQWIEIAVPAGVDMTDWQVNAYNVNGKFVAKLLQFGRNGAPASKLYEGSDPVAQKSHYAFYTIKSPYTVLSEADATWTSFDGSGVLNYTYPYAFELVRPSGIIEHRVVAQGWNQYRDAGYEDAWYYDGTNLVKVMSQKQGGEWVWSEEDKHLSPGNSVNVITNQGGLHAEWKSPLAVTPGDINVGQYISPDWFLNPNGGYVWIYSTVLGEHMRQILGTKTNTVTSITVAQGTSTNIVFEVDRWYKLGECEVEPSERSSLSGPTVKDGKSYYKLDLVNISNRIDITAKAGIADAVSALIPADAKAYEAAIMKWLEKGVTGGPDGGEYAFKHPDGPLQKAYYRGTDGTGEVELDLAGMYFLDIDPTEGNWELWGGMGEPGGKQALGAVDEPKYRQYPQGSEFLHTNHQTTVWLMLTNIVSEVVYPPYRLQGLNNEQSDLYTGSWTSVNFKVTMALINGKVDNTFQPMRYFVFGPGSFRPADDALAPFCSRIEIVDPFSDQSPASEWGWKPYSGSAVPTKWAIDFRITPAGVSTLKYNDTFD